MTDDNRADVACGFDLNAALTEDAFTITPAVTANATVALLGLTVTVEGIKQGLHIEIRPGADKVLSVGLDSPCAPTGGSATVDLPAVTGQGTLKVDVDGKTW